MIGHRQLARHAGIDDVWDGGRAEGGGDANEGEGAESRGGVLHLMHKIGGRGQWAWEPRVDGLPRAHGLGVHIHRGTLTARPE